MRHFAALLLLVNGVLGGAPATFGAEENSSLFKLTLLAEPSTLDPQKLSSASGNYITTLLSRGLYRWTDRSILVPDEGHCTWASSLELHCTLSNQAFWSNGDKVTAKDYLRAFEFLLQAKNAAPQAALLFSLKNAQEIYRGKKKPKTLGFTVENEKKFSLRFKQPDGEFLYKLVHPALYPRHKSSKAAYKTSDHPITNGPFYLASSEKGSSFTMKRNPFLKISQRPNLVEQVKALVVESDTTTLQLYDAGKVQLARRVPADLFSRYKDTKDFHQFPVLRFDYVGFGPELHPFPELRKALAQAFDPKEFQKIFMTEGKPGCPSLSNLFFNGDGCFKRSKKPLEVSWPKNLPPILAFSQMGGEDIKRAAEWFQGQWKKYLNVEMELQSREQKVYLNWLRTNPPAAFRKGVSLDRPTCLAALEIFGSDHPENYIHYKNPQFDRLLKEMSKTLSPKKTKELCTKGLKQLIQEAYVIPLGEMKFSILVKPRYIGWEINSLNQLFLTDLKKTSN